MRTLPFLGALLLLGCGSLGKSLRNEQAERPVTGLPAASRVDVEASEVDVHFEGFGLVPLHPRAGTYLRAQIAQGLGGILPRAPEEGPAARFRIRGRVVGQPFMEAFPCLFILKYLGCPKNRVEADLEVDLEVGDRRFSARGQAVAWEILYYQNNNVFSEEDQYGASGAHGVALARAVHSALTAMGRGGVR